MQQADQINSTGGIKGVILGTLLGVSAALLGLVVRSEGLELRAYQDSVGIWTICYGHTKHVRKGDTATRAQCDKWLAEDLAEAQLDFVKAVDATVTRNELDAFTDMWFNIGANKLKNSTIVRKLNAGDNKGACAEILRWRFAGGKDCRLKSSNCRGLLERREREYKLCMTPHSEVIKI